MSTLDDLKKMTGAGDIYRFSSGEAGENNTEPGQNNPHAGGNGALGGSQLPKDASRQNEAADGQTAEKAEFEKNLDKRINDQTLQHLKEKESSSSGKTEGNTPQQDGGTLPEVNVKAERKGQPDARYYEQKAATLTDRLANMKGTAEAPKYEDIPEPPKRKVSLSEIYKALNPGMSDEEQAKVKKRERRESLFNGIADAISAIAALRGTGEGAINTFYAKNTLSAAQKRRMEQWAQKVAAYNKGLYDAQMKDADLADKDYRARLEYVNARNALKDKLAGFGLKLDDFGRQGIKDAIQAYIDLMGKKITHEQFKTRMDELSRHNKATESLGRGRLDVARENADTSRGRFNHQVSKDAEENASNSITVYDPKTNEPVTFSKKKDGANYIQKAGKWMTDRGHKFTKPNKWGISEDNPNPSESEIKNAASRYSRKPASHKSAPQAKARPRKAVRGFGGGSPSQTKKTIKGFGHK